ncbi:MAG: 50S ribosomal protein L9 [Candidatus Doudnabacteria bacterium]|nr:50S ribosomal protein L9 [Candidatus Doudnabacteria bacterium]
MPMKIILTRDVSGLGRKGKICEVSDGYARNFLIARHLAAPATSALLAQVQKEEAEREEKMRKFAEQAENIRNRLQGKTIKLSGKAQGLRLFAAIHEAEIAQAVNREFNLAIEPKQVIIKQAIKSLGTTEIEIKILEQVNAKVKVEVEKHE